MKFAQVNFARQAAQMEKGFTTKADYDASRHALQQARERVRQAEAAAAEARTKLAAGPASGLHPPAAAALVQLSPAHVNPDQTHVRSPRPGPAARPDRAQTVQSRCGGLPPATIRA